MRKKKSSKQKVCVNKVRKIRFYSNKKSDDNDNDYNLF